MRLLIYLGSVALAFADYQKFFFSDDGTCPGLAWSCVQGGILAACAYDSLTDKHYCCGGEAQASCRVSFSNCIGRNGGPSSTQQLCTVGKSSWCCLKDTEECTSRSEQINVCIGTQQNTIGGVSQDLLSDMFSSLSSAAPAATAYVFDATSLSSAALSTSSPGQPSTSSPQTASMVGSPSAIPDTPGSTKSSHDPDTLSGGKVVGIVVGCVAGVAAMILISHIVLRRHRRGKSSFKNMNSGSKQFSEKEEADNRRCNVSEQPETPVLVEMGGGYEVHELPNKQNPSELSTR